MGKQTAELARGCSRGACLGKEGPSVQPWYGHAGRRTLRASRFPIWRRKYAYVSCELHLCSMWIMNVLKQWFASDFKVTCTGNYLLDWAASLLALMLKPAADSARARRGN